MNFFLFRTEVAPAFILNKNSNKKFINVINRFDRECEFCKHVYGELHVNDAFHVLFKCPLVANERVKMFSRLDNTCGAYEWERVNTLSGLGILLLSPQDINAAWVVGRFLSEYLAAREILFASSPFSAPPVNIVSSKWLGGPSEDVRFSLLSCVPILKSH